MKCCIVSSKTVAKYGRWDPRFYLGETKEKQEAIDRAEEAFKDAARTLGRQKVRALKERERVAGMRALGEVQPLETKNG